MLPILFALGVAAGLIGFSIDRATGPSRKSLDERETFERLKLRKVLTLDEAEDGLVLARRFGDVPARVHFEIAVDRMRKKRAPI